MHAPIATPFVPTPFDGTRVPWNVTRLTGAIGAVVHDLSLADPLDERAVRSVRELLWEHQVLFFRKQDLSPRQHRDFAARFGELHVHPIYPKLSEQPEIMVLDTERNDLRDNALWHTDVTFLKAPAAAAVLHARQLPAYGGDTLWSSGYAAYDALSLKLRILFDDLRAEHDFTKSFPVERFGQSPEARASWEHARAQHPPVSHPVIRTHPESGRRTLFVNEGFTSRIEGLEDRESRALLDFLFAHIQRPEFVVRWRWEPGDVAFWDNRCTQHYACDDYRPQRRIMHRATILGEVPR